MDTCVRWTLSHGPDAVETAKAHEALKSDPVFWDQLVFTGLIDAGSSVQEQRTCPACGSSLCRPVDAGRIDRLLNAAARLMATSLDAVQSVRQRPPLPVLPVSDERRNRPPHHILTRRWRSGWMCGGRQRLDAGVGGDPVQREQLVEAGLRPASAQLHKDVS